MSIKYKYAVAIMMAVLVTDQLTKLGIYSIRASQGFITEVLPIFNIVMVYNFGISFGLFQADSALSRWGLVVVTSVVVLVLVVMLTRAQSWYRVVFLSMIIGGATGNIIDRIWFGKVIDFLDFHLGAWHWPSFNIGDIGIVLGAFMYILESRLAPHPTRDDDNDHEEEEW